MGSNHQPGYISSKKVWLVFHFFNSWWLCDPVPTKFRGNLTMKTYENCVQMHAVAIFADANKQRWIWGPNIQISSNIWGFDQKLGLWQVRICQTMQCDARNIICWLTGDSSINMGTKLLDTTCWDTMRLWLDGFNFLLPSIPGWDSDFKSENSGDRPQELSGSVRQQVDTYRGLMNKVWNQRIYGIPLDKWPHVDWRTRSFDAGFPSAFCFVSMFFPHLPGEGC